MNFFSRRYYNFIDTLTLCLAFNFALHDKWWQWVTTIVVGTVVSSVAEHLWGKE
jgi:hypothetical protein